VIGSILALQKRSSSEQLRRPVGGNNVLAGEYSGRQSQEQRLQPDRAGRNAMKLLGWLAAAFVILMLVGCAVGQGPQSPAPYQHDNGGDIRSM
jgi:hypothetical protein